MSIKPNISKSVKNKSIVQNLLKQLGPMEAAELAGHLGISAMGARQHLYALQEEGLVSFETTPRQRGRPAKLWKLTDAANRIFPDAHADLSIELINLMRATFGEAGLQKLLDRRAKQQLEDYRQKLDRGETLEEKLLILAEIRKQEGYMAAVEQDADGRLILIENHCPVCAAAACWRGLCARELDVFSELFRGKATVRRQEHILAGARRCAYLVIPVIPVRQ